MQRLLEMPVLHADQTSIRVNRKNHWIHSCSFADIVVKKCHPNRGAKALDAINIIPRCGGRGSDDGDPVQKPVLVYDRWATYFKYDDVYHALYGAHLLRILKLIEKAHRRQQAQNMRQLMLETCREVNAVDAKKLSEARFEEVSVRYRTILAEVRRELPERLPLRGKKGRISKSEVEKLLDAFETYESEILRFAGRSEVPFSNSRARHPHGEGQTEGLRNLSKPQ